MENEELDNDLYDEEEEEEEEYDLPDGYIMTKWGPYFDPYNLRWG